MPDVVKACIVCVKTIKNTFMKPASNLYTSFYVTTEQRKMNLG